MTGTNCDLCTHKSSRSYLNHLVFYTISLLSSVHTSWKIICEMLRRHEKEHLVVAFPMPRAMYVYDLPFATTLDKYSSEKSTCFVSRLKGAHELYFPTRLPLCYTSYFGMHCEFHCFCVLNFCLNGASSFDCHTFTAHTHFQCCTTHEIHESHEFVLNLVGLLLNKTGNVRVT